MSETYSTLIDPSQLEPRLSDPGWVVFDCRHQLTDHAYGPKAYAQSHIPGACYADMESDLSGPKTPATGRHPLPEWSHFREWLGSQGVSGNTQVVAYDDNSGVFAARLWYMLRLLGHGRVAVLNGGLGRWKAEGRNLDSHLPQPDTASFQGEPDSALQFSLEEVSGNLGSGEMLLVDARGPGRYRGEEEPMDPKAGHIPGALNLPFPGNVNEDGTFKSPEQLKARLLDCFAAMPPERVVHYCGSGVSAAHNLLAQAVAGLPPGKIYTGSWSQWCSDGGRPVATGPNP